MIDLEFVESLIRALDESSLDTLELDRGGTRIRLSKTPTPQSFGEVGSSAANVGVQGAGRAPMVDEGGGLPQALPPEPAEAPAGNLIEVTSPMVGTFYRAPSPDADPFVAVGARIGNGSVLCIIEAMKLMNELESEVEGTVAQILVENAEPVEFGQVLFLIDPS